MSDPSNNDLTIAGLFNNDLQLASPPNIYFELKKIVEDPNRSMADAAFVIEKDASLSIRLLKIVNSAFYGFPSTITSIDRAINLIGAKELQSLTLSTIVIERFTDLPDELISMHDFWARNLHCALIAQGIDFHLGNKHSDSIFISGLLHNIGELVFFRCIPELAIKVNQLILQPDNLNDTDEITIETEVIGFDHYQTGAALTELWRLPEEITASIRLHAFPETNEEHRKIAAIVRLADCYSKIDRNCSDSVINCVDISADEMSGIIELANDKFEDIFKVFYPG